MRNKILRTLALVLALTLCVGASVMAAPSISVKPPVRGEEQAEDKDGNKVDIIITDVPEDLKDVADELEKDDNILDIFYVDGDDDVEFPIKIEIDVDGIGELTDGYLIFWDGDEWIKLETFIEDGKLSAWIDSFGMIGIYIEDETLAGEATSPQTSAGVAAYAALAGISAAAAAIGLKKKR